MKLCFLRRSWRLHLTWKKRPRKIPHSARFQVKPSRGEARERVCNDVTGKLVHLEFDDNNFLHRVWIQFCDSEKIGRKIRKKAARFAVKIGVNNLAVPIDLPTASISLTSDKKWLQNENVFLWLRLLL